MEDGEDEKQNCISTQTHSYTEPNSHTIHQKTQIKNNTIHRYLLNTHKNWTKLVIKNAITPTQKKYKNTHENVFSRGGLGRRKISQETMTLKRNEA